MDLTRLVLAATAVSLGLASITGCSVLGIATKGDLEKHSDHMNERTTTLERKTHDMNRDLGLVAKDMKALSARWSKRLSAVEAEIDQVSELRVHLTSLAKDVNDVRSELTALDLAVSDDLQEVRQALGQASNTADRAQAQAETADRRGQRILDSYLASLRQEREHLRHELNELEQMLSGWQEWESPVATEPALRHEAAEVLP